MSDSISLTVIAVVLISYLLGNLSPSTIMGKLYGIDIRKSGSGNPGTTNTLRSIGPAAAAVTLLIDVLKGVAAVLLGKYLLGGGVFAYACGTAVFLGHIWPVCYRFKGGKGIATGFGVMLTLDWRIGLILLAVAALGALLSKRMSVGSIAAGIGVPVCFGLLYGPYYALWGAVLGLIVIWRHRSNVVRLMHGEEPPIGFLVRNKEKSGK